MTKLTALSVIFLTLACIIHNTQACSCLPGHLQNYFCDPNYFIIQVNVVSSEVVQGDAPDTKVREITVDVQKNFKNNVKGDRIFLTTSVQSALCGIYLPENSCYVVSGTFDKGNPLRYRINNCAFHMKCSAITNLQWKGLYRDYRRTCSSYCKVCGKVLEKKCILHLKMSV